MVQTNTGPLASPDVGQPGAHNQEPSSACSSQSAALHAWLGRFMVYITYFQLNFTEVVAWLLSHVQLFVTSCSVAHQAPRSVGFSRQEYWSGVALPSPEEAQEGPKTRNERGRRKEGRKWRKEEIRDHLFFNMSWKQQERVLKIMKLTQSFSLKFWKSFQIKMNNREDYSQVPREVTEEMRKLNSVLTDNEGIPETQATGPQPEFFF